MGRLILVESQKGYIGKTVVCIKTGITLSQEGKNVLLMDLSGGKEKISEYLNVNESIIYDVKDVLDGICSLEQAVIEVSDGLSLLPCPRIADKLSEITRGAFTEITNRVKETYDFIIADVDKASSVYINFSLVSHIITVNNNDFSCIKEFNNIKSVAQKYNINNIFPLLNMYHRKNAKKGTAMSAKDIKKMTGMDMDVIIEENHKYSTMDYDYLFSSEDDSFSKAVKTIAEKVKQGL